MVVSGSNIKVLYISGFGRSGSTIVDNVLGQLDGFFSAGEMRLAWDAGQLDTRLCGCGETLAACPIWSRVLPDLPGMPSGRRYPESHDMWVRLATGLPCRPPSAVAEAVAARYRRLVEVTGARVVVDSSKKPLYAWLLGSLPGIDLYLFHMVRDPRGVAYSWQKRKQQPGKGAGSAMRRYGAVGSSVRWDLRNAVVERQWSGNPERYRRVRYEDLMAAPRDALADVAAWLGEEFTPDPFVRADTVLLRPNHTVWGNPSRFRVGEVQLRSDDTWTRKLSRSQRRTVEWITWPLLRRYGYRR